MSKIASSCENCIFSKARMGTMEKPEAPKPEQRKFLWWTYTKQPDYWDNLAYRMHVAQYNRWINSRWCNRFPDSILKHKNDICGEYKPT